MIYIDPGDRRADTMTIVSEHCAVRNVVTGEFKLVGKACGYTELVMRNLAAFFDAGVIAVADEEIRVGWVKLKWTKTGHYLWQQWREGPPRAVVELPKAEHGGGDIPSDAQMMLNDQGWTIANSWKTQGGWVAEVHRVKNDTWQERILLLDAMGIAYRGLSREDAAVYAAALVAAAR